MFFVDRLTGVLIARELNIHLVPPQNLVTDSNVLICIWTADSAILPVLRCKDFQKLQSMNTFIKNIRLYHITNISNLHSILSHGQLYSYNDLKSLSISYRNIAYNHIQEHRSQIQISCGSGGTLHDYIPFSFAPRSPMLYSIYQGNVQEYQDGQEPVIHLVTAIENIVEHNIPFVFTDGHAAMAFTQFYDNLEDIDKKVDLELMKVRYWRDTEQYPDRKRRRQAEFLIYKSCSWHVIRGIGVINSSMKQQVEEVLEQYLVQTPVQVFTDWYY